MTSLLTEPEQSIEPARDSHRRELTELLELEPDCLADQARLVEDLGLDSLAMMRILVWLESHGVIIDSDQSRPSRVADLLSLLDTATAGVVSIRIGNGSSATPAATDLPPAVPAPADPLAPVLAGHGLRLDPVTPDEAGFLYTLAAAPETSFRWRYRGAPPSVERFAEDMWKQVLVQFVVRRSADGDPIGQLVAYGADPTLNFAYLGAVFTPPHTGTGLAARAVAIFVRYLFHTFPLGKVYLEVPGYNWQQVRSGEGTLFQVEGVLRDHHLYAGRRWDQYLCAIYRDDRPPETGGMR